MPFDQAPITSVRVAPTDAAELFVWWTSTAPEGTVYQVYLDRRLTWSGTERSVTLPYPLEQVSIDVGAVDPGEARTDLSATLPAAPADRVLLSWTGGTYLDPASPPAEYRIYASPAPGEPVSYDEPVAVVAAAPGGVVADGYGMGGYGAGGYGHAASYYQWRSGPLAAGDWLFVVVPADELGNEGDPTAEAEVTIEAPPGPPAIGEDGQRLRYEYDDTTGIATLSWLAP